MDTGETLYWYLATCDRVVDGDTLDLTFDLGMHIHIKERVRVYGINTPEVYGVKKDSEEYERGCQASARVKEYIDMGERRKSFEPIAICSFEEKIKKVYKGNPNVRVYSRFTHVELERLLNELMETHKYNKYDTYKKRNTISTKYGSLRMYTRKILFEAFNAEFEDIYALKQASLIAYLSGI